MKLAPLDSAHIELSIHAKKLSFYKKLQIVNFSIADHINFFHDLQLILTILLMYLVGRALLEYRHEVIRVLDLCTAYMEHREVLMSVRDP